MYKVYIILNTINTISIKENLKLNFFNVFLIKLNNFFYNTAIISVLTNLYIKNFNKLNLILLLYIILFLNIDNFILLNFFTGYYKIHPILFYISFLNLIIFFFKKKLLKINFIKIFLISILSFFLGSLWALKQSLWGKYWSADYIEIVLLFNLFLGLYLFHFKKSYNLINFFFFFKIFIILVFLRLNLLYTKHNFFNQKKNLYIYTNIYLIFMSPLFTIFNNKIFIKFKYLKVFFYLFILIIIFNKLNFIYIYTVIKNLIYIIFLFFCIQLIKVNKYYLVHLSMLLLTGLYIFFYYNFYKILLIFDHNFYKNSLIFFYFKKDFNFFCYNSFQKKNLFKIITDNYFYLKNKNNFSFLNQKIIKLINFF